MWIARRGRRIKLAVVVTTTLVLTSVRSLEGVHGGGYRAVVSLVTARSGVSLLAACHLCRSVLHWGRRAAVTVSWSPR